MAIDWCWRVKITKISVYGTNIWKQWWNVHCSTVKFFTAIVIIINVLVMLQYKYLKTVEKCTFFNCFVFSTITEQTTIILILFWDNFFKNVVAKLCSVVQLTIKSEKCRAVKENLQLFFFFRDNSCVKHNRYRILWINIKFSLYTHNIFLPHLLCGCTTNFSNSNLNIMSQYIWCYNHVFLLSSHISAPIAGALSPRAHVLLTQFCTLWSCVYQNVTHGLACT